MVGSSENEIHALTVVSSSGVVKLLLQTAFALPVIFIAELLVTVEGGVGSSGLAAELTSRSSGRIHYFSCCLLRLVVAFWS